MSKWNQMKRFGYPPKTMKGVPRPKTWADFHKAYLSNQIYLFNLKSFTIQWAKRGSGNAGARYFNYYLIPPLVYWNPDIRFNRYKVLSASPPFIKLEMMDGTTHKMDITPGMKEIDILKQVLNLTNESERR